MCQLCVVLRAYLHEMEWIVAAISVVLSACFLPARTRADAFTASAICERPSWHRLDSLSALVAAESLQRSLDDPESSGCQGGSSVADGLPSTGAR